MSIIGIDPGIDGGIAIMDIGGKPILFTSEIPTLKFTQNNKERRDYDRCAIIEMIKPHISPADTIVIENQHAFPARFRKPQETCKACDCTLYCASCSGLHTVCPFCGTENKALQGGMKGSIANFRQGQALEVWLMIAAFFGLFRRLVDPRTWQKHYGIASKHGDTKDQAKQIATELFPQLDLRKNSRCRTAHSGICDSLLIADYGRTLGEGF